MFLSRVILNIFKINKNDKDGIFHDMNTSESDCKLHIHEADYKFKRPIIYSRGRLYIQEADYTFLMALPDWPIQRIENKIIIQKIKVKTSG